MRTRCLSRHGDLDLGIRRSQILQLMESELILTQFLAIHAQSGGYRYPGQYQGTAEFLFNRSPHRLSFFGKHRAEVDAVGAGSCFKDLNTTLVNEYLLEVFHGYRRSFASAAREDEEETENDNGIFHEGTFGE